MSDSVRTSRQRILDAVNHREPDRVPFDLGGSTKTGITLQAYDRFVELMGLVEEPDESLFNFYIQFAGFKQIPTNILEHLKVDTRGAILQLPSAAESTIKFENGAMTACDEWGIKWARPESSFYLDPVDHPLKGELTGKRLADFDWPDPVREDRFSGLKEEARRLRSTGCAVMISISDFGPFEIAQLLHGVEETLVDLVLRPSVMEDLLERVTEFQVRQWEETLETVGENVDICLHSDDLGMQNGPIISPEMYRRLIKPYHSRLFGKIKRAAKTDVKMVLHSCGSVRALIPDLIETGIDALNPIQVGAAGMEPGQLKRDFGDSLCFWGGTIDPQQTLPRGTVREVENEVRRRIDELAPGGGFVFSTINPAQPDVPPENLRAMWETFQEHCGY